MWKWILPIALLLLLGSASGIGISSSNTGMASSGSGMSSSETGSASNIGSTSGTGYAPWQEGAIEGLKISFHMGQMYALANQGQNISDFNAEVDNYNTWVQKNFGNNASLLMPKTNIGPGAPITSPGYMEAAPILMGVEQRKPFNASNELGKFGKQQVMTETLPKSEKYEEAMAADWIMRNF